MIDLAEYTEHLGELLVIYKFHDHKVWAQPLKSFMEPVPLDARNVTMQRYRFVSIGELMHDYINGTLLYVVNPRLLQEISKQMRHGKDYWEEFWRKHNQKGTIVYDI